MKNCPYCGKVLVLPKEDDHFQLSSCHQDSHDFEILKDKFFIIDFYNDKKYFGFSNFSTKCNYLIIQDLSLIENKTLEEVEALYNKLSIFE